MNFLIKKQAARVKTKPTKKARREGSGFDRVVTCNALTTSDNTAFPNRHGRQQLVEMCSGECGQCVAGSGDEIQLVGVAFRWQGGGFASGKADS